ncbi:uncharacterized protein EDB93DRAFT_395074 [Suillus bovinus]|uniref:uncharacterized protein n=1 Tax=Suillus bovinus TaxID=48563 RepID=UPI001B8717E6|nr:uncharacterized protein EDB93DRAFT_395074 [Suillus bovinus]KAG2147905.1 hypothetical protein EDB93DRAFT_395074 [Suillus bovinus]
MIHRHRQSKTLNRCNHHWIHTKRRLSNHLHIRKPRTNRRPPSTQRIRTPTPSKTNTPRSHTTKTLHLPRGYHQPVQLVAYLPCNGRHLRLQVSQTRTAIILPHISNSSLQLDRVDTLDQGLRDMGMRSLRAPHQVATFRVRRLGQGMGVRRRVSTHKVPGRVAVCMLYKISFWTCQLGVQRLRRRDPKLLSQICDMRIILVLFREGMNILVGSNHRMSLRPLGHLQLWLVTLCLRLDKRAISADAFAFPLISFV